MKKIIIQSFKMFVFITFLTGIIYPFFITMIGQTIFPYESNGSIIKKNDVIVGSKILGQQFSDSIYFHPRPSSINYLPMPSGASNLGLSSALLKEQVNTRKLEFRKINFLNDSISVPSDVLFASGSGVDPHISVESAKLQIKRILMNRNINPSKSKIFYNLIDSLTEYPQFGVLGNKVVNVLSLNLKLDEVSEKWKTQK